MIDKGICDKGFIWNPSNSERECDKSCDIGECLVHENSKCRKRMVDKLVEEFNENIDEVKTAKITLAQHENKYENVFKCSCTLYIVLLPMIFTIKIGIASYFAYYKYLNHVKKQLLKKGLSF